MMSSYAREQALERTNVAEPSRLDAVKSEHEAIQEAQRGNEEAFAWIYQLHCRRVYGLCLRMLENPAEAEDLTQEVFLTLFRKIQTFRGESAFSTWLHRITVNMVLMHLRKKTPLKSSLEQIDALDGVSVGPAAALGGQDVRLAEWIDRVNLNRAMDLLAPRQKLVFELHDIQGYKHKEIAQIMAWTIGNSKAQLHRARRRLRELLHETFGFEWRTPRQVLD